MTPCLGLTALYFSTDEGDQDEAVSICRGCPERKACLERAVLNREGLPAVAEGGVFGGAKQIQLRGLMARTRNGKKALRCDEGNCEHRVEPTVAVDRGNWYCIHHQP